MKKKWIRIAAVVAAVGIVAGNASTVVYAHHSRRAVTGVQSATCYQNGYCTGNGSCDVDGVCQNGGICVGTSCYQGGNCGVSYYHHGHH